jgi:hypothetical protein
MGNLTEEKSCLFIFFKVARLDSKSESKLIYDWLFIANPFCLGVKPLESHDQTFFQLNSCGFSDEKMGLSLTNVLSLSSSVRNSHTSIACY